MILNTKVFRSSEILTYALKRSTQKTMTITAFSYDVMMPRCLSQKYDALGQSKEVFQVISSRIEISCLA